MDYRMRHKQDRGERQKVMRKGGTTSKCMITEFQDKQTRINDKWQTQDHILNA